MLVGQIMSGLFCQPSGVATVTTGLLIAVRTGRLSVNRILAQAMPGRAREAATLHAFWHRPGPQARAALETEPEAAA